MFQNFVVKMCESKISFSIKGSKPGTSGTGLNGGNSGHDRMRATVGAIRYQ
jgi:hypothetical protein